MGGDGLKSIRSAAIGLEWLADPPHEIAAGDSLRLPFRVTNRGTVRAISDVVPQGPCFEWCRVERPDPGRQLFRDRFDDGSLLIAVPRSAMPGPQEVRLIARVDDDANWIDATFVVVPSAVVPPAPPDVAFRPPAWRLAHGTSTQVTLVIQSAAEDPTEYSVVIDGLDRAWDGAAPATITLGPRERESIVLELPPAEDVGAGQRVVTATVTRRDQPDVSASSRCNIDVPSGKVQDTKQTTQTTRPPAVTVQPNPLQIAPGMSDAKVVITVANVSDLHEVYRVSALGPPDWCQLEATEIALAPGETRAMQLTIRPYVSPGYASGQHPVRIAVAPLNLPRSAQIRVINVSVPPRLVFELAASPLTLSGRKERIKVRIANTGSSELNLRLSPQFRGRSCDVRLPQVLHLDVGERKMLSCVVGAHRNGLLGRRAEFAFQISGTAQGSDPPLQRVSDEIRFIHEPFMTNRFAGVTLLAALLLVSVVTVIRIGPVHAFSSTRAAIECRIDDKQTADLIKDRCQPPATAGS